MKFIGSAGAGSLSLALELSSEGPVLSSRSGLGRHTQVRLLKHSPAHSFANYNPYTVLTPDQRSRQLVLMLEPRVDQLSK